MNEPTLTTLQLVRQFHNAFGVVERDSPCVTNTVINNLRLSLLAEELGELDHALNECDKLEALDALCDLQYVLDGAFLQLGFASVKESAFREVHRSNMTKVWPDGSVKKRPDGKIIKPPGYTPPNLKQFIP